MADTTKETKMAQSNNGTRTYLVEKAGGKRLRITVPETWKVTFAPVYMGEKSFGSSKVMALRFYESDTKQRAIFTEVTSFRDVSIPVEYEHVTTEGSTEWRTSEDGSERVEKIRRKREWAED